MGRENTSTHKKPMVSASDLSQIGVCKRLVRFEAHYGKRPSRFQREAIARGSRAHAQFFKDGVRSSPKLKTSLAKPWCFIATATFGPLARETQTLRLFRDSILRKSAGGRAIVKSVLQDVTPHLPMVDWQEHSDSHRASFDATDRDGRGRNRDHVFQAIKGLNMSEVAWLATMVGLIGIAIGWLLLKFDRTRTSEEKWLPEE